MVSSKLKTATFINHVINFLRLNKLDGIDLDWEYPTQRQGGRPQDKENYAILITVSDILKIIKPKGALPYVKHKINVTENPT